MILQNSSEYKLNNNYATTVKFLSESTDENYQLLIDNHSGYYNNLMLKISSTKRIVVHILNTDHYFLINNEAELNLNQFNGLEATTYTNFLSKNDNSLKENSLLKDVDLDEDDLKTEEKFPVFINFYKKELI